MTNSKFFHCTVLLLLLFFSSLMPQTAREILPYTNPALPIEKRVNDLLSRMTLEEKIGQLQSSMKKSTIDSVILSGTGGLGPVLRRFQADSAAAYANKYQKMAIEKTRLGIPLIIHDEGLHGLIADNVTSFPQAIGLAATWNPALMTRTAEVIGREAKSRGVRQLLSPVVNIARDVRWGRVGETYGEDPLLSAAMGAAYCKAIETQGVVTTPKHFAVNHGDGGRDSNPVHLSERELREVYFPPFKACFQDGGARSVMPAYNALDGTPCTANGWLLTDVLRKEWGFKGYAVSDYYSTLGILNKHFVTHDKGETAKRAIEAGMDVELPDIDIYGLPFITDAKAGKISLSAIDDAVRNVLRVKFELGLFDSPYVNPAEAKAMNNSLPSRQLAREAAREAIVLLKNQRNTLPLKKDLRTIAVLGPNADSAQLGDYSGFGMEVVTTLQGIKNKLSPSTKIIYEKGCEVGFASYLPIPSENLFPAGGKPGETGLKGEYFTNKELRGQPLFTRIDKQVHFTWAMGSPDPRIANDFFSVRWTGKIVPAETGIYSFGASTDDGVRLWLDGKLLIQSWYDRGATVDVVRIKMEKGKSYGIKIEYYENDGWSYASLVWDLKREIDPGIQRAVEAAKKSDAAVIVAGIIEGEGYDRANLNLPGKQEELIRAVAATGTPVTVVLLNGSAVTMMNWIDTVAAVMEAWYPGEEGGNAIADVLFGDYNPGGKLPLTFPQFVGQVPLYYNPKPTGRGVDYSDMNGLPLFPFGHGLSYTSFKYSNIRLSFDTIGTNGKTTLTIDIENTGKTGGDEVVQFYLHTMAASVTRPVKELKGFKRISLQPSEKKSVQFDIGWNELSFLDSGLRTVVEPGSVELIVGSSSADIRARTSLTIIRK